MRLAYLPSTKTGQYTQSLKVMTIGTPQKSFRIVLFVACHLGHINAAWIADCCPYRQSELYASRVALQATHTQAHQPRSRVWRMKFERLHRVECRS